MYYSLIYVLTCGIIKILKCKEEDTIMEIIDLNEEQAEEINNALQNYNNEHIRYRINGSIAIGIRDNGKIVAGLVAYMTVYRILYVDTVFVNEQYRRKGYGRCLMEEMEKQAKEKGATIVRLDTFDWQGKDFYLSLGYREAGHYRSEEDDFEEYFFVKMI